jgi:hypothetical protein
VDDVEARLGAIGEALQAEEQNFYRQAAFHLPVGVEVEHPGLASGRRGGGFGRAERCDGDDEEFSHGLNERVRLSNIRPGLTYYLSLVPDLAK